MHQLLEALAFNATQKVRALHPEIVEVDGVFLHPAIAEHFDLAARNPCIDKGLRVGAGGFFGQEHRQAAIIAGAFNGAGQNGHHMGAGGMGDPCLVAIHHPVLAIAAGAGAQAAKVRPGVRFGEDGRGQNLTAGEFRQPLCLLFRGAATQDQFGGDLGPGAKGTHTDIAARQFFGDHHHAGLGQTETAEFFGDGQAKDAHFGKGINDFHRDEFILQVPFMGIGRDLFIGKAAELIADHFQLVIQTAGAKGGAAVVFAHQRNQLGAGGRGVALGHKAGRCRPRNGLGKAKVLQARDLSLAHGDATMDVVEVFAVANLKEKPLHFREFAFGFKTSGPGAHLAQAFDIGGQPSQRMGGVLVFFQRRGADLARDGHHAAQVFAGGHKQRLNLGQGGLGQAEDIGKQRRLGHGLAIMRHSETSGEWIFCSCERGRAFASAGQLNFK